MKVYLDYLPPATVAGKVLLGEWQLTVTTDDGAPVESILTSQKDCLDRAKALGLDVIWSDRARKAGWAAFRAAYRRK